MILHALDEYYRRKCDDPDPAQRLPDFGWETKEIPFILDIDADGALVQLCDTRELQGKKKVAQAFRVPMAVKRASGVVANLLWDTLEYVLGVDTKGKPERVAEQHAAFRARMAALPAQAQADVGLQAVLRFLEGFDPAALHHHPAWAEMLETNPLLSLRLHGDEGLVCQRPAVAQAVRTMAAAEDDEGGASAMCLVSGMHGPVQRLHAAIKGVWGAQTSGANIVSFNARAFESYGKTERQGENAPVGRAAAFAYTTALNHLLRKDSRQRMQVGDASTVFWTEKAAPFETLFGDVFQDDPDQAGAVRALLEALHSGRLAGPEGDNRFHVLGLAPNAARISVRFYHCLPLRELGRRVARHFEDLKLVHGPNEAPYPSLFRLLTAVALQGKADNVPPSLGGGIVNAVLAGENAPYPRLWLNAAVGRCRAERQVTYLRAAALKACLNRQIRLHPSSEKEFLPMLDLANPHPAYRLGRLFAVLEKAQEEASPGLNATIRDRYYGAASSTPVAVFTTLLRLKNAHLKKLNPARAQWFEKLLGEVLAPVAEFPAHLALPDQGRFALGYYHQRQDFFTKKPDTASPGTPDTPNVPETADTSEGAAA
ncbi:type I-C CRISPR-associated protein Cas8c/Csd1 [Pulveribacter sp.]|uniref:type I-C CRISPR-associated protein Cas8c/Csd1 n=1 Tax=Pulveribacter sp. TaxID=2678893 RepID=UPI0028B08D3C|nr:type I-C CRISPR-associated protein Cas8c/Csd1 [Pulveribacter sp.]